jgi:hypothetical protein
MIHRTVDVGGLGMHVAETGSGTLFDSPVGD